MLVILRFKHHGEENPQVDQERDYMDSVKKIKCDKFRLPCINVSCMYGSRDLDNQKITLLFSCLKQN
jgi:hypothetical protein